MPGHELAPFLQILKRMDKTRTDELLLQLVAAHGSHHGQTFSAGAETEAVDAELVAERGRHDEKTFTFHALSSLYTRASSEPSYTTG